MAKKPATERETATPASAVPKQKAKSATRPRRKRLPPAPHDSAEALRRYQSGFVCWAARTEESIFVEPLLRFVPQSPEFWEQAAMANMSRDLYIERLTRPKEVLRRIEQVNRGASLLLSAAQWENPRVGADKPSSTVRGKQWRLAIGWAGIELIKVGISVDVHNCPANFLNEWCHILGLEELSDPIPVPRAFLKSRYVQNLWSKEVEPQDFLGLRGSRGKKLLKDWWAEKQPISHYGQALQGALTLRDMTAHGFLSAKKTQSFGLVPSGKSQSEAILDRFIPIMIEVTIATLKRLRAKAV